MIRASVDGSIAGWLDQKLAAQKAILVEAARLAAQRTASLIRQRLPLALHVGKQDWIGQEQPADPVSVVETEDGANIVIAPFYADASNSAVIEALRAGGDGAHLQRSSLVIHEPHKRGAGEAPKHRVTFAESPHLLQWAEREDKGLQVNRRAVWMQNPEVLISLLFEPLFGEVLDEIKAASLGALEAKNGG